MDPEIQLMFAAYLNLLACTNRFGYVNQARDAIRYALLHRGWRPHEDEQGTVCLKREATN
jgi:hypothetical protein